MTYWSVPPAWQGQTAFVIAGGPSVSDVDTDRLRGRRVVAINQSFELVPFADILFFGDAEWWGGWREKVLCGFSGLIVTVERRRKRVDHPRVLQCRLVQPVGPLALCESADALVCRFTSVVAVFNLLKHLGVTRIVTIGLDGQAGPGGRTHHYERPHDLRDGVFARQRNDLRQIAGPMKAAGIEILNASPSSAIDAFPHISWSDALAL